MNDLDYIIAHENTVLYTKCIADRHEYSLVCLSKSLFSKVYSLPKVYLFGGAPHGPLNNPLNIFQQLPPPPNKKRKQQGYLYPQVHNKDGIGLSWEMLLLEAEIYANKHVCA
jgi:hypothetical protein